MSRLRRCYGSGRKVYIERNQELTVNEAKKSRIALNSGSVDGGGGLSTLISGSISHVTGVNGEYQPEEEDLVDDEEVEEHYVVG